MRRYYIYVNMLNVHNFKKKQKKTVTCFLWEVVISSGTELSEPLSLSLSLSLPRSSLGGKEKGGAVSVDSRLTG